MGSEKPIEWCLLWMQPCLPSSEWAAWAQAIFSAGAVIAAIGVVWWQHHVKSTQDYAAAQLAGSGILTFLDQTTGGLQSVVDGLAERIAGNANLSNSPTYLATFLKSLPRPSREDLVALNSSMPSCSVGLLRASNAIQQVLTALDVIATIPVQGRSDADLPDLYRPLHELANQAVHSLQSARLLLEDFCPK
jgi:hypothetical protein